MNKIKNLSRIIYKNQHAKEAVSLLRQPPKIVDENIVY